MSNDIVIVKVSELPEVFAVTPSDYTMVVQGGKSYRVRITNIAAGGAAVYEIQTTSSDIELVVPAGKILIWMVFICSEECFVTIARATVDNVVLDQLPVAADVPAEIQAGWYAITDTTIFISGLTGNTTIKYYLLG